MRMMLRVSMPTEPANAAMSAGTFASTLQKILGEIKPEAAYFISEDNGERTGLIFFDMTESSQIPAIAEPFFHAFNARVTFRPAMNPQDLASAGPALESGAKNYGKKA